MSDEKYMRRCFELAERGLGAVAPNPMVGAVIVCQGEVIGEGYHQRYGGPHAEVNAIRSVERTDLLPQSTIYVSLEPCSHYGKTPPCADLIIEKRIPNVVVSNLDPFPEVSGRGIEKLKRAGVNVRSGLLEREGWWLNRRFFTFHTQKRPFVILKWAQSADGFLDGARSSADELPLMISSEDTQVQVHRLRASESAILVGTRTALLDNPSLTVRRVMGRNPLRVLIDRTLQVPFSYNLYDGSVPTLVFTENRPSVSLPSVEFVTLPFGSDGKLPLDEMLGVLYQKGVQSLVVEGGGSLLDSFRQAGLWDEMRVETKRSMRIGCGVLAPKVEDYPYRSDFFGDNMVSWYRKKL